LHGYENGNQPLKKECAGIAPAPSASPKLLQEGLAGRNRIAGDSNIRRFYAVCNFFYKISEIFRFIFQCGRRMREFVNDGFILKNF
jgi:hypothetical protein